MGVKAGASTLIPFSASGLSGALATGGFCGEAGFRRTRTKRSPVSKHRKLRYVFEVVSR